MTTLESQNVIQLAPEATKPLVFKVEADEIAKLLRLAHIDKRAPLVDVDVTLTDLRCTVFSKDKTLSISATAPLHHPEHTREARFTLPHEMIFGIGSAFDGVLRFSYDENETSLDWFTEGKIGRYASKVLHRTQEPSVDGELLSTMPVSTLGEAVQQAAIFAARPDRLNGKNDGLRVGEQAARSGYTGGLSRYVSSNIPQELEFYLSKRHAKTVRAVLAKLSGPAEIFSTETSVELRTECVNVKWAHGSFWPVAFDRAFQAQVTSSFSLPTSEIQRAASLMSIGLRAVQMTIETNGDLGRLVLSGHNNKDSRGETPVSPWMNLADLPQNQWTFYLDVGDLLAAAMAVRTETVSLDVTDRGLMVRSTSPSYETVVVLAGFKAA